MMGGGREGWRERGKNGGSRSEGGRREEEGIKVKEERRNMTKGEVH